MGMSWERRVGFKEGGREKNKEMGDGEEMAKAWEEER
jgi:hypothetical protein